MSMTNPCNVISNAVTHHAGKHLKVLSAGSMALLLGAQVFPAAGDFNTQQGLRTKLEQIIAANQLQQSYPPQALQAVLNRLNTVDFRCSACCRHKVQTVCCSKTKTSPTTPQGHMSRGMQQPAAMHEGLSLHCTSRSGASALLNVVVSTIWRRHHVQWRL